MANSANAFAAAPGSGQTTLYRLDPQPYCDGLQYPQETVTPEAVYEDGDPFVVFRFNSPSVAQMTMLYARLGITSAKYASVTVSLPTTIGRDTWADYNGQAVRPIVNIWEIIRYGQVEILIRKLAAV